MPGMETHAKLEGADSLSTVKGAQALEGDSPKVFWQLYHLLAI